MFEIYIRMSGGHYAMGYCTAKAKATTVCERFNRFVKEAQAIRRFVREHPHWTGQPPAITQLPGIWHEALNGYDDGLIPVIEAQRHAAQLSAEVRELMGVVE